MINIEINGQSIQVQDGSMVIEAADAADIAIPRFCYHKKLSIAANCRMCLVEIEKAAKPLPACATPVTEGMKIFTRSPKAIAAQKGVMEFLLINHPLDCPICDQGGECELQDLAMGYGKEMSRYGENKRVVGDKNLGPLIATDMTRCIHCTRCVRFGKEIAGVKELGATGRGEHMKIGTFVEKSIESEISGNVIDLCPVGALTSKPFRFTARPWELVNHSSIAPHDLLGSNILIETRRNKVLRVIPKENEAINEVWLSDRDRFSYSGLQHQSRLTRPRVRTDGEWSYTDWNTALQAVAKGLIEVKNNRGADQIAAFAAPSLTNEENYLLAKIMQGLGSHNIDHRIRQADFRNQENQVQGLGRSITSFEELNACLLIGGNVRKDQPLLNVRLRKASILGGDIMSIAAGQSKLNYDLSESIATSTLVRDLSALAGEVAALSKAAVPAAIESHVNSAKSGDTHKAMAKKLVEGKESAVLLASEAIQHSDYAIIEQLGRFIALQSQSTLGVLSFGANSLGANQLGVTPYMEPGGNVRNEAGLNSREMFEHNLGAYLLYGVEPSFDCWNVNAARKNIEDADFVVAFSYFETQELLELADVILPITPFSEMPGSFINGEGITQEFTAAVEPLEEARPGWKVLRVLGNLLDLEHFDYVSIDEVRDDYTGLLSDRELSAELGAALTQNFDTKAIMRVTQVPASMTDSITRRAEALFERDQKWFDTAVLSEQTAQNLSLDEDQTISITQDGSSIVLRVVLDNGIAENTVLITLCPETTSLSGLQGEVSIEKKSIANVVNE